MSTTTATTPPEMLTTGAVARRLRVRLWQVRRMYERGILPEPGRAGRYRLVPETDLPAIREALAREGYLLDGE